jgi:hypothetical protein
VFDDGLELVVVKIIDVSVANCSLGEYEHLFSGKSEIQRENVAHTDSQQYDHTFSAQRHWYQAELYCIPV